MADNIFQGGPDAHSMDLGFGPDPEPRGRDNQEPATPAGQIVMSQEQFQQLLSTLGAQRQQMDYAEVISGQESEGLPEIDFSQLPDPRTDFEAFQQAFAAHQAHREQLLLGTVQSQISTAQQQQEMVNDAWAMMREKYPELADQNELVQMASTREQEALRARGLDPMAVLAQNMEGAVDAIATRAMASLNRIRGIREDAGDDAGRTEMVSGGSPRPRQPAPKEQPGSFVDELKKAQRELGIY